ncbi:cation-translocating P-type ATPase [Denitratisoma oestradiolicum]|nr:HAD-IC family P-type ATPase [Denitratisoma oestradiolicum]TWO79244.1 metal-transporting ATPase [Denitratisoma oestradiolicum]
MLWHAETPETVAQHLITDLSAGLTGNEANHRLERHGLNRLIETPPRPIWRKFLDQFRSLLILLLLGAALLAGMVGDIKDALIIASVVLINALLGLFQEHRAEAALAALKNMLAPVARVRRDGRTLEVEATTLVPGDLLLLEAGDRVPADARIVAAHGAEVAEAALTGESQAIAKRNGPVAAETILAERNNMLYMNTVVTRGRLEALVTATGMATEMGRLADLLASTADSPTPLQVQLDHLGKRLATIAGIVVGLIFLIGLARGDDLLVTTMTAIALAVAAIPEGLPAVVTVTLALGMHRMARRHAVVKKLAAVETLGCTTVICTDKTGTLTLNQMTARRLFYQDRRFTVSGEGYRGEGSIHPDDGDAGPVDFLPLLTPAVLCADARIHDGQLIGDPTEGALLALSTRGGMSAQTTGESPPRLAEIPFDAAHKYMATFHREGDWVRIWLKGAPDVLLPRASRYWSSTGALPLEPTSRQRFAAENAALAGQAMRVLALAGREIPARDFDPAGDLKIWVEDLTLIGLVGIIDPPRPEVRDAVRSCQSAGIAVKMITGDHAATATAIARDLGLAGEVHEGRELDGLTEAELAELVLQSAVLARVAPEHKMRIVAALQSRGHVVAMTGDGVNDAPALRAADIGVAMGITGTEVTQEAATLVLTDDNFASIVGAVREGRAIYDNIVKFVRFQLSTNIGAMLTVLAAPLFGLPTPFTAIQILWVNIIMDGPPAMTLGVEPPDPKIMTRPPRGAGTRILTGRRLLGLGVFGLIMAAGTLAAYARGLSQGGAAQALTLAFTTFVLFQAFNIFNARAESNSAFNRQFFNNGKLWLALGGVLLAQVVVVHWPPAQGIFSTVALSPADWLWSLAVASSVLLLEEARKLTGKILGHRG